MSKSKESFDRRQRERAKKAKAEAKRQARLTKDDEAPIDDDDEVVSTGLTEDDVLERLAALHAQYDDEAISFDDFEIKREELLAQLRVT